MLYSGLNQHNSNLREHQIEAKGKIFDAWDKYDSVMLQMPTGTGKTYLFTSIINDLLAAYKEAHHDIHILPPPFPFSEVWRGRAATPAAPNWHWAESANRGSWCRRNRRI